MPLLQADRPRNVSLVEWDVQPWSLGFPSDQSPDLSLLLAEQLAPPPLEGSVDCAIVLVLLPYDGPGERTFHAPSSLASAPQLVLTYEPPTTALQLGWTNDTSCAINASVPAIEEVGSGSCETNDAAAGRDVADASTCPHLLLEATAATSTAPCALSVNGLNLVSSCGLDRSSAFDGVCVAVVDQPNAPRTACFDTRTEGAGAGQLASWIDALPTGTPVVLASCSRLAWPFSRTELGVSLAQLGALAPPTYTDDAYALVGIKGGATPLAEAKTPRCANPNPVCITCSQTVAHAAAEVACGVAISPRNASLLAGASFVGAWGSPSYAAAVGDVSVVAAAAAATATAAVSSNIFAALQATESQVLDAACATTALTSGAAFGARLATDGDLSSYWLSAGGPDALLTLDFSATRLVRFLSIDWLFGAASLLVLYSGESSGDSWSVGASIHQASTPPTSVLLNGSAAGSGVLARRLRLYLADAFNTSSNNGNLSVFAIRELRAESCVRRRVYAAAESELAYRATSTPRVLSVSPSRGSTAGGTNLVLTVDGVNATGGNVTVTIAGIECRVTRPQEGNKVYCTTGNHGLTTAARPGTGYVQLTVAGTGTAVTEAAAWYAYVDLWSRGTTWGGGLFPLSGDSVWIPTGQSIMLDISPPRLYMLVVQGALIFDRVDIELDLNYIFVQGGTFQIGTEVEPFQQQATITLHGSPVSQEIPTYGAKVLGCRFCTLDLHGKPVARTHTKLAQTARQGATEIWLTETVDWTANSQILITSTAANGTFEEFETATLIEVLSGGTRLRLASPTLYDHLGETISLAGGHAFEFRANVALLSRNVVIQGDPKSVLDKHGAHIMLHSRSHDAIVDRSQGESLTGRIENIELRYAGQMGRIGRYSVHWHMIGAVRNSYFRSNSVHHTYNRMIALHGVHFLRVQNNIGFENLGHALFIEDGAPRQTIALRLPRAPYPGCCCRLAEHLPPRSAPAEQASRPRISSPAT